MNPLLAYRQYWNSTDKKEVEQKCRVTETGTEIQLVQKKQTNRMRETTLELASSLFSSSSPQSMWTGEVTQKVANSNVLSLKTPSYYKIVINAS